LGGLGKDTLQGSGGNDLLDGGQRSDRIFGGDGNDIILAGSGRDTAFGGSGDDTIYGGDAADTLVGGAGNDLLNPGAGRDILIGGAGRDTFEFDTGSTGGGWIDQIKDFNPEEDKIRLARGLLPRSGLAITRPNKPLKPSDFKIVNSIGSLSRDDKAKIIYEQSTGLVYYNNPRNNDLTLLFQLSRNLDVKSSNFEIF